MERSQVLNKVQDYVVENFYFGKGNKVRVDTDLMEDGAVDSTGFMELVTFVEESFPIEVEDEDLAPENFGSIERIVDYVMRISAS